MERWCPECRILYEDGREEWHQLPPSHPLLIQYLELNPTELESIYMIPPGRFFHEGPTFNTGLFSYIRNLFLEFNKINVFILISQS